MAGYKQTIQNLEPKLFLTFDGDAIDATKRTITALPHEFIDESGYANSALLQIDDEDFPAYRMGLPSMVELEQDDQGAISFGWYGRQAAAPLDIWPKSFIEVAYQSWFSFLDNNGSFSVGFMMNRETSEQAFRDYYGYPSTQYTSNGINRTIIRKQGAFDFYYQDNYNYEKRFIFQHPGGTFTLNASTTYNWLYGKDHHFFFVWDVKETTPGTFVATAKLYINGHIYTQSTHTTLDTPISTYAATPIEIGGSISGGGILKNDRATSKVNMDQIAIFDRGLTDDEVMRLYKKTRSYDRLVLFENATHYWSLGDAASSSNFVITNMTNSYTGEYLGGNVKAVRAQNPPPQIGNGSSTYFQAGGMGLIRYVDPNARVLPIADANGDWTVHFWASASNTTRSVLFSLQEDDYPNVGILCEMNMRNGTQQNGSVEFSLSDNYRLSSLTHQDNAQPWLFNDGVDHHFALVKRSNTAELWIDGRQHSTLPVENLPVTFPGPGSVYLMGAAPGKLSTTGRMSRVAYTPYALGGAEIRALAAYNRIWRIKGTVTLQGNPHQATVRLLAHNTGELVKETLSSNLDGFYSVDLFDNRLIDLMVLNKQDTNIKYRAYGPITPMGYEDLP